MEGSTNSLAPTTESQSVAEPKVAEAFGAAPSSLDSKDCRIPPLSAQHRTASSPEKASVSLDAALHMVKSRPSDAIADFGAEAENDWPADAMGAPANAVTAAGVVDSRCEESFDEVAFNRGCPVDSERELSKRHVRISATPNLPGGFMEQLSQFAQSAELCGCDNVNGKGSDLA
eukprot:TRINITY_DN11203_c1_g1_i1.p1 TRINITY_DN11203_c1_g1~~TRINITY_DN11203_c1_g1_i1.p1  ORF type:complete len:174 (-),score=33.11 TRINITY_DN11203_c1_g1_i1:194-715(-)